MSEGPDCYSELHPKSRKEHKCCECLGVIRVGERYQLFKGVWSGDAYSFKTCLECEALRKECCKGKHPDDEPAFGDLTDYLFGHDGSCPEMLKRYIENAERRGGQAQEWMRKQLAEEMA